MKQRMAVRAIIRSEDGVLLARRATGRETILGKYELPGGKIAYGEQPEDTLRRYLHDDFGLHIQAAQLFDAVTYIDHDDRAIQYGVLVYMVSLVGGQGVTLSGNYDTSRWIMMSELHQEEMTDLTQLVLGIVHQDEKTEEISQSVLHNGVNKTTKNKVIIYSDGGSRGNPGPSAAGFVIVNDKQELIEQGGEYLGITTNSQAEYQGVRLGLERAIALGYTTIECRIDSMLVVNQMNGVYKVKNRELWPIHDRIRELVRRCQAVRFVHVRREFNQLADGMVNRTLDEHKAERQEAPRDIIGKTAH